MKEGRVCVCVCVLEWGGRGERREIGMRQITLSFSFSLFFSISLSIHLYSQQSVNMVIYLLYYLTYLKLLLTYLPTYLFYSRMLENARQAIFFPYLILRNPIWLQCPIYFPLLYFTLLYLVLSWFSPIHSVLKTRSLPLSLSLSPSGTKQDYRKEFNLHNHLLLTCFSYM